jgi:uncharacterized protein YvpB
MKTKKANHLYTSFMYVHKPLFISLVLSYIIIFSSFIYRGVFSINTKVDAVYNQKIYLQHINSGVDIKNGVYVQSNKKLKDSRINSAIFDIKPVYKKRFNSTYYNEFYLIPKSNLIPNHIYNAKIEMTGILNETQTTKMSFSTQVAPSIQETIPKNNQKDVALSQKISIKFNSNINDLRKINLQEANNKIGFENIKNINDREIEASMVGLKQDESYTINIIDDLQLDSKIIQFLNFSTPSTPIATSNVGGMIYPGQDIVISFSQSMKNSPVLKTNFDGSFNWINDRQVKISPVNIKPGAKYFIKVPEGFYSTSGGVNKPQEFYYETNGEVRISSYWPSGNSVPLQGSVIIQFNQDIDKSSINNHVTVSGLTVNSIDWLSGSKARINVSPMNPDTKYNVQIAAGVKPVFGLPNNVALGYSFITETKITKLNVPAYKQQHSLSCEASALRMALAYRGIYQNDMTIVNAMGYNPRPRDVADNLWDNPYKMFVGDVNGVQNTTGWGVFAEPTAKAARLLGASATAFYGINSDFIADQIWSDRPVVVWGHNNRPSPDSWKTDDNSLIPGYRGEHTRTVIGVKGTPGKIYGFYLNDPGNGATIYWTAQQMNSQLNSYGGASNQAVVIY